MTKAAKMECQTDQNIDMDLTNSTFKNNPRNVSHLVNFSIFHYFCTERKLEVLKYAIAYALIAIISIYLRHFVKRRYLTHGKSQTISSGSNDKKRPCPVTESHLNEDGESFFSIVTSSWVRPLMEKARSKSSLSSEDICTLPKSLNVDKIHTQFSKILKENATCSKRKGSLLSNSLHQAYGKDFYFRCGLLQLMAKLTSYALPLSLGMLITFFETNKGPAYHGYRYVCAIFMAVLGVGIFSIIYEYYSMHVYFKVRISIMTTIYEKILRLDTVSLSMFSTGQIVNFLGTDTDRIVNLMERFHRVWIAPIEIVVCMLILYQLVGIAFLGGLFVTLLVIPINKIVTTKRSELDNKLMQQKDRRMKLMNEVFGGIKIIKLYTWEDHFRSVIDKLREAELQTIRQENRLGAVMESVWVTTPVLITLTTFSLYSMLGHTLTASKMCTCVSLLLKLIRSVDQLPMIISRIIEAVTSLDRIEKFVVCQELDLDKYYTPMKDSKPLRSVISVDAGEFTWKRHQTDKSSNDCEIEKENSKENISSTRTLSLQKISIDIRKGQFIGVVGKVGAGKSSLLHAVMAEMTREKGNISVSNLEQGFALACQEPWVQQATIRDNVLFGSPFNSNKYTQVLNAVSLHTDLHVLPDGDKTGVGENGVTLSGGQKSRLALARAIYQDKDVYLLDDPLAAVDSHVAQHIYDECIMGLLQNKTRILCTHHVKFLGNADLIVVMDGGSISRIGTPSEILEDVAFAEHDTSSNKPESEDDDDDDDDDVNDEDDDDDDDDDVYDYNLGEEEKATGEINSRVYKAFLSSLGKWLPIAILLSVVGVEALEKLKEWWLTHWISTVTNANISTSGFICFHDNTTSPNSLYQVYDRSEIDQSVTASPSSAVYYLSVYGCFAVLFSLTSVGKEMLFSYGGIRLARSMHNQLLSTMFKAPMTFFDTTPIGRILNVFSSDMATIDDISDSINCLTYMLCANIGTIWIVCYGMPSSLILLIPMAVYYYRIQKIFRHTFRESIRIESLKRSPVFSHFSETLSGVVTVRAFRGCKRFKDNHFRCMEEWLAAWYTSHNVWNWLFVHTKKVVNGLVVGLAGLAVVEHSIYGVNPGVVGILISYILYLDDIFEGTVTCVSDTEKDMVSVERVQKYVEDTPSERWEGIMTPQPWPTSGVIRYRDVLMKYRDDLPNVLKNLSFCTRPAEKVGIVGRTGSGKSSLFQTLFRTVEISSGDITVDGVYIQHMDLKDVRRHLTMIPQDPVLFNGSVRENLDPASSYSDQELWGVLEKCHLHDTVVRLGGLEGGVSEKGRHFSLGQRQLICLARAVLTKAKVLCIDEATASVDLETDMLIQATIRQEFNDSTVLTVAHRINTIMNSDRVLVMDQGRVVELDSPENLLKNSQSAFYKLVHGEQ
ncbi:ATP-binding cassette sub-family C member 10-like [Argopecten irradians]|uniref:ATP-binding cassette sub-family C member 10-like n=1 Tax=Argopecten irradians TaxID=31199 RepID=UPI0037141A35